MNGIEAAFVTKGEGKVGERSGARAFEIGERNREKKNMREEKARGQVTWAERGGMTESSWFYNHSHVEPNTEQRFCSIHNFFSKLPF